MAKFRFDSLLKIREAERQDKKNALLEAQNELQEIQGRVELCRYELVESQNELRRLYEANSVSPLELQQQRKIHENLRAKYQKLCQGLEKITIKLEERRIELKEAVKEVKTLEMLKEKMEQRQFNQDKHRSNKEIDDLAIQQKNIEMQITGNKQT